MKKLIYNQLKPQNYYNRLATFFLIAAIILNLSLAGFAITAIDMFILKVFIIFFLLILISVMIEFFYSGDYMSPLEILDIETFYANFSQEIQFNPSNIKKYFNKYDTKTKKLFDKKFILNRNYILSSIRKNNNIYIITIIDSRKLLEYFVIKFLAKRGIHKLHIKKIKGEFKIINFK